jgi:predicted ATP-dependent endonuclease of OLD family
MKVRSVRIQNFRCIEDTGEFHLDEVTCLVGKNESGKTTILAALEKLNAVEGSTRGKFSKLDYPRRKWRPDAEIPSEPPAITTTWDLTPAEVQELEATFCKGALSSREVVITKGYDNVLNVKVKVDEEAIVRSLISHTGMDPQKVAPNGFSGWTIERLQSLEPTGEVSTEMVETLTAAAMEKYPAGLATIDQAVRELVPKFLYFGEYQKLPGQLSLERFNERKAQGKQSWSDLLFEALLSLAGTSAEDVSQLGTFEELNASLRAVSNQISAEIFKYWTQNKYLDFILRFDPGRPEDPAPWNSGSIFRARIDNRRHKSDTNFDDRSSGFVWFFSFLVWFSQLKKHYHDQLVILLDEPGLTLHARAQGDLLRYIRERLKPQYQVVYTTHSPFMVDPDNLLSARTVEDIETADGTPLGTKVGEKVLSTDADTISPLQRCLDYEMTQTLFVGRYTVLVEGPSDLLYLKWASHALMGNGGTQLDYRWTLCIIGGVDRIAPFYSLFKANGLHIAAVVDYASGQKQKVANARKAIGEKQVLTLDQYAGQPEADIEDVIGRDFYIEVVNRAYSLKGSDRLQVPTRDEAPRIVKYVEEKLKLLPRVPEFDHCRPAEWLTENPDDAKKLPGYAAATAAMQKLITDLNSLL